MCVVVDMNDRRHQLQRAFARYETNEDYWTAFPSGYLDLPLATSQFPWSSGFYSHLLRWSNNPTEPEIDYGLGFAHLPNDNSNSEFQL